MRFLCVHRQTKSKDEAIAWTRRFLTVATDDESEMLELHEVPAFAR
jgi:hypothetical protein